MNVGREVLAGLVDLAQVAVQAHTLHLELLLDVLHLLLVGALHQNAGELALSGRGQLGQHLVLCAVQGAGVLAVVQLLAHLFPECFHGIHLAHFLGKIAVQGGQLADADIDQLDLEDNGLSGQVLDVIAYREGDVDLEFLAALVAQNAVLKAGDHPAAAQLQGLVLCGTALEGLAVQQALVIDVNDVALNGRALVGHQLGSSIAAALQHGIDLFVGDGRGHALHMEAGGLGQVQLRLQRGGGGGYKALVLFNADQVIAGLIHRLEAVLGHGGLVQGRNIAIHQVVDGIIPECVLAAVGLDLSTVSLALGKALDGVAGAGALIHRIGCGLQLFSCCAEGHLADTLFGSFHAYQFHRNPTSVLPPKERFQTLVKLL